MPKIAPFGVFDIRDEEGVEMAVENFRDAGIPLENQLARENIAA